MLSLPATVVAATRPALMRWQPRQNVRRPAGLRLTSRRTARFPRRTSSGMSVLLAAVLDMAPGRIDKRNRPPWEFLPAGGGT